MPLTVFSLRCLLLDRAGPASYLRQSQLAYGYVKSFGLLPNRSFNRLNVSLSSVSNPRFGWIESQIQPKLEWNEPRLDSERVKRFICNSLIIWKPAQLEFIKISFFSFFYTTAFTQNPVAFGWMKTCLCSCSCFPLTLLLLFFFFFFFFAVALIDSWDVVVVFGMSTTDILEDNQPIGGTQITL